MNNQFNIPVCLFIFQRKDTVLRIIERIAEIKPTRLYLMSDEGRNDEEKQRVKECRETVEKAINWPCEIIKDYAKENRGVFANIGLGALRVFEKEEYAIFLEDDNLPELTFFPFCQEMLEKYKDNDRVLWICGTNYLGQYDSNANESYMFTQNLLPCGWASWAEKFTTYYDKYFDNYTETVLMRMKDEYRIKALYDQQMLAVHRELDRKERGVCFRSWDYQMMFSIMSNDLVGISPVNNQIKNIGVDVYSEHGGSSINNIMTKRFCGMESYPLSFPLHHPATVQIDPIYEDKINRIILYPWYLRLKTNVKRVLKVFFPNRIRL